MNWTFIGCLLSALGVVLGAFGAHALRDRIPLSDLEIWKTAVFYHLIHSFALVVFGKFDSAIMSSSNTLFKNFPGYGFLFGVFFFSGSLYTLVLLNKRWLGAITPIGGVLFILSWAVWAWNSK